MEILYIIAGVAFAIFIGLVLILPNVEFVNEFWPWRKKDQTQPEDKRKFHETWTFLIVFCIILPILFRTFIYSPFHIPSGSMKPNLLVGDYIFVSKFAYGYSRYSLPFGVDLITGRIMETHKPKRGDVIVFKQPTHPSIDFIKRLVGLPGDEIQVKDGVVYINGKAVKKECSEVFLDDENEPGKNITECDETFPEGLKYKVLDETKNGALDNTEVYKVPPGHYFFMGDNRDNSMDSRVLSSVGYVPEENLVGKAEMVFFSGRYSFLQFWKWPHLLRTERFFKVIK